MMKSGFFKFLVVVLVLAAAGFAAARFFKTEAPVSIAKRGRALSAVPATVSVRADYITELRSEVTGRVKTSSLELGRRVQAGEVVIQIDDTDLRIEVDRLRREYDALQKRLQVGSRVKLELETAKENLANYTRLAEAGTYPAADLEKRKREVRQIEQSVALEDVNNEASLTNFKALIQVQERQIEKSKITAPIAGDVIDVVARKGDLVIEKSVLGSLLASARVVEAKISEENFAGVRIGQEATVRLLGYGTEQFSAKVTKVLPNADPLTQRYTIHLTVDIAVERLVPGLSGEASIIVAERAGAIVIPRRALQGEVVLVVNKEQRVEERKVKRGYESLNDVEILSGLAEGEQVITDDLDRFRAGDRVQVVVR